MAIPDIPVISDKYLPKGFAKLIDGRLYVTPEKYEELKQEIEDRKEQRAIEMFNDAIFSDERLARSRFLEAMSYDDFRPYLKDLITEDWQINYEPVDERQAKIIEDLNEELRWLKENIDG